MKLPSLLSSTLLVFVGSGIMLPVSSQTPVIPVESVESPELPTGNSNDIQGIENNYNNWNWGVGGRYPRDQKNDAYIVRPESSASDSEQPTEALEWENTGEPSNSGAKIPLGNF